MRPRRFIAAALRRQLLRGLAPGVAGALFGAVPAVAAPDTVGQALSFGSFGRPGLVDMPTGAPAPDATLGFTYTYSEGFTRNALFFQFAPWLSATLRYGGNGSANDAGIRPNYDRSLDLIVTPLQETARLPALSFGLQDVIGTGGYAGEFVAASKTFADGRLSATIGLGWGRLASRGGFDNPLGRIVPAMSSRPPRDVGRGGRPAPDQWFRGDAAVFGGISYRATDRLTLIAEYSSDDYTQFRPDGTLSARSPVNLGLSYRLFDGVHANAAYLQGAEWALGITLRTNVKDSPYQGSRERMPGYVVPRGSAAAATETDPARIEETLAAIFRPVGLTLLSLDIEGEVMRVAFANRVYDMEAQAFGRAARWMTHVAPPEIAEFELVAVVAGMPTARLRLSRADLEAAEHAPFGTEALRAAAELTTAPADLGGSSIILDRAPRFGWSVGPYALVTLFDPDEPRRADVGLQGAMRLTFGHGLVASTTLKKRLAGNRDAARTSNSVLPRVRSDQVLYDQTDAVRIEDLHVAAFHRLAPDIYARASFGYFEQMYAGISGEVLWNPFASNWALGLEVNHVIQRDFDGGLGFRDYRVTTGHASASYHLDSGYYGRIDAGRYLAGDTGATFTVGRSFPNGWDLSAYATFTDVSFEDFGEGSFDKGIRLEIPLATFLGTANLHKYRIAINSINRDGGRRVMVPGRLSEVLEGYSGRELEESWARILR